MELKTLRNLREIELTKTFSGEIVEKVVSEGYASKIELKEELRKWVKALKTATGGPDYNELTVGDLTLTSCREQDDITPVINFIEHFLNEDMFQ